MKAAAPGRETEHDRLLGSALEEALAPWRGSSRPFTLLFSGGVDSSLLAWELRDSPGMLALTVGRPGSRDLVAAETAAQRLGLRWTGKPVGDSELHRLRTLLGPELESAAPPMRGVFLALGVALERAVTSEVLVGQGADELFLGYAHFRGLSASSAAARAADDLRRLLSDDWPRTERIARLLERTVAAPYLAPAFRQVAQAIPIEERLPLPEAKRWLRRWAARRGLPQELAGRPKAALQYGTGVARWLARRSQRAEPLT